MSKPTYRPSATKHLEIVDGVAEAWSKDYQELFKQNKQLDTQCDAAVERVTELEAELEDKSKLVEILRGDLKKTQASRDTMLDIAARRLVELDKLALAEAEVKVHRDLQASLVARIAALEVKGGKQ